jgi:hypothetical protein
MLALGDAALDRGHYLEALEYYETVRDFFPDKDLQTPELTLKIENQKPWSPDRPFTYEYRATVTRGKQILDSVFSLFAVRKVSLGKGEAGAAVVCLNNTPVFLQGVNWSPIRPNFADVTRDEVRLRAQRYRDIGCNLLRVWGVSVPDFTSTIARAPEQSLLYGEHTWGGALSWVTQYTGKDYAYGEPWKKQRTEAPKPPSRSEQK